MGILDGHIYVTLESDTFFADTNIVRENFLFILLISSLVYNFLCFTQLS